ncbi:MAG: hypothetical protein IIC03_04105, partial [Proteobacteria bacterium]|nr:hypothetical protein [Pseudomonadota bacterium]
DGDTYLFSIGQGNVLATPLQVVSSFVPIANGGTLYEPPMVKEILGNTRIISPVVVTENIVSESPSASKSERGKCSLMSGSPGSPS